MMEMEVKETGADLTYGFLVNGRRQAQDCRQGKGCEELGKEKDNSLPGFPGDAIILDCRVTRQNKQAGIEAVTFQKKQRCGRGNGVLYNIHKSDVCSTGSEFFSDKLTHNLMKPA